LLFSYTERIAALDEVLDDLNNGRFVRTQVEKVTFTEKNGKIIETTEQDGKFIYLFIYLFFCCCNFEIAVIKFDRVPIVTPNGDVLLRELTFEVSPGMNCLITG
jgi:ATP-binding cassette subfamily D (ALD) protein 3